MKFLTLAYMQRRFPGRFGSAVKPAYIDSVGSSNPPPEGRLKMAIEEAEAWLVAQIPVFGKAKPETLPEHLRAALADIACDSMFDTQAKDADRENSNAQKGRELILSTAPSYEGAKIVSNKIALNPDAAMVPVQRGWK